MLTPEQIEALRDAFELISEPITNFILSDITKRIVEAGELTRTSRNRAEIASLWTNSSKAAKQFINEETARENAEFAKLFNIAAKIIWSQSKLDAFAENETVQQIVKAAVSLADENFSNITQTLGMVDVYGNPRPLQDVYRNNIDYVFKKVITGADNYQNAVREATANISKYGVQTVDYESGVVNNLDVAVRRSVFGGLGLMVEQVESEAHDEMGADGWEISAHEASAIDHEPYQGRQFSDAEFERLNGTPEKDGILKRRISTLNCKHIAFPIILGVNQPQYTEKQLQDMKDRNAEGVEYDGKHYTSYEATQMQRALERKIRQQRRKILMYEQDPETFAEELQNTRIKLNVLNAKYKDFSSVANLRTQNNRLEVLGYNWKQEQALPQ